MIFLFVEEFLMSTIFKRNRVRFSQVSFALVFALALPSVHAAGVLEQILANPRVQQLLGVPANVASTLNLCGNPTYKAANAQACADAGNASMVLKLPFEMRTVMSNAQSAQSLRDICLAAQNTAQRDSYLCAELAKADTTFAASLAAERNRTNNNGLPFELKN
jgi:hypothetical protein